MKEYKTVKNIEGPLVFVEKAEDVAYGEIVEIETEDGDIRKGEVLDTSKDVVVVQVYEETRGIGRDAKIRFKNRSVKMPLTEDLQGRILDGTGQPLEGPEIVPEEEREIVGNAINPYSRDMPEDFIETGISAIDTMNTLVRGQKLPVFSGSGLPHNKMALQIARQAEVKDSEDDDFMVVFAGMGITNEEAQSFIKDFKETGALERAVVFLNRANDPAAERILTPRMALTTAEYFAFEKGKHVLVILTDMTNYCNALREIGSAREEVPGRRGYPGYMYTDLAQIYERAGAIRGKEGSITQIPILTMVGDDITHPIPDLTGYITEGQIVLDRSLHNKGVYPPIDVLTSLSRLMDNGVGEGKTREDHSDVSDQLYASYAEGKSIRELVQIVGEGALSDRDREILSFAESYEENFLRQGENEKRTLEESLDMSWDLLKELPSNILTRIDPDIKNEYLEAGKDE